MNGPTFATRAPSPLPAAPLSARTIAPRTPRPSNKAEADASASLHRLVVWIKLYWLMMLFTGSLIGAGLAYLAWTLLPAKYESYAQLRVASAPFTVTNNRDPNRNRTDFNTYLKTNAKLVRSEFVLRKALSMEIDGKRISELETIKALANPITYLEEELQVSHTEGVEIITVSLRGHLPDDVQKIVNAVQNAFMDEVIEKEILERSQFLNKVEQELVKLQGRLNDKVQKPVAGIGVNPMAVGLPPVAVPAAAELPESVRRQFVQQLIQKFTTLQQQVDDLPFLIRSQKDRVDSLNRQLQAQMQGPPAADSLAQAEKDTEVLQLLQKERFYRAKYNQYRSTYNNPDAETLNGYQASADAAEKRANELKMQKAKQIELSRRQSNADNLFPKLDEETRRLRELEDQLRSGQERLTQVRAEIAKLPPDPVQEKLPEKQAEEKKPLVNPNETYLLAEDDIFRNIAHHAATLRLDIESPKRVSILQPASIPAQKDAKKQILGTVFAALLGFGLVGLGIVAYETRTKKLCGLPDIKQTLNLPVVGVIPWSRDLDLSKDRVRQADVTESIDKLRSYVSQTWLSRGATTIAVTSPLGDEGKSFTSFQLANSLSVAGYKTLLVDFDLRKPTLHQEAGLANTAGVSELLRGEADFRQTIVRLPDGLHLLPAGAWSETTRQAAVGSRLEALLQRLKEPFDCVVIQAHSLLTAAESVELARRCEVVLLCTNYRESRLPLMNRAADRLTTLEVPYTGVVYLGATSQEALC